MKTPKFKLKFVPDAPLLFIPSLILVFWEASDNGGVQTHNHRVASRN